MFNAIKGVAAVAIVAVGGYLLVGTGPPSAEEQLAGAEWAEGDVGPRVVSGSVTLLEDDGLGGDDVASIGPSTFEWTTTPARVEWASSDPRLSGTGHLTEHGIQHTGSLTGLRSEIWTVSNAEGSWTGTGDSYASPRGGRGFVTLTGAGAYDGLTVYLAVGEVAGKDSAHLSFEGVVVPASPPSLPDE